ncbi:MAG: bifunctional 23S rRNA (guanine(2069)-N(7))-methyltransferase RlmK/23S rRNA (guanine(2445)-N(2))-methyltransferase RlmL [Deltaproteobacteria bacterium]|nr:bifunctional 23S rRNA (guanine(2069)-N(7))-methyltransferase RlmK/23S rRNA (guanine(2445)-N(2))-methyltransferase RlmL [Deltaproteobacteria bacterium]
MRTPRPNTFAITCARGTEALLVNELEALGVDGEASVGAVEGRGGLQAAYRAMLGSRIAQRVLWPLGHWDDVFDADALYPLLMDFPWEQHLGPDDTFAIRTAIGSKEKIHARYLQQRVKDALVDRLRDRAGRRPDVDRDEPDVAFHVHFADEVTLALDLAGRSLHRRHYRPKGAKAPLKETLAAAILHASGWKPSQPLLDPMCGSGTLLVEAALMARAVPPGRSILLGGWRGHDERAFRSIKDSLERDAKERENLAIAIRGRDTDPESLRRAGESLRRAGVHGVMLEKGPAIEARPFGSGPGHLVVNPPYGERLGASGDALRAHLDLGTTFRHFPGWEAHVITGEPRMLKQLGLKSRDRQTLYNGPIRCTFASYAIAEDAKPSKPRRRPEAEMLVNRLRKNLKRLRKWAAKRDLDAYRIYDAEIPEYNVVIDRYGDAALVQEHHRPRKIDPGLAEARLRDTLLVVQEVLELDEKQVHLRVRARGEQQYEKRQATGERHVVREGSCRFEVNLQDYLDTGLFLDHRDLRAMAAERVGDGRFLNLFAYTCTASVVAAAAGAKVTSVDLSKTYLAWGEDNFRQNDLDPNEHVFEPLDVRRFLSHVRGRQRWDTVLLAPPSFSRSSRADELDLRRDHAELIESSLECLAPGGALFFSTHARDFELDPIRGHEVKEITRQTVPRDFQGEPHRTWRIE